MNDRGAKRRGGLVRGRAKERLRELIVPEARADRRNRPSKQIGGAGVIEMLNRSLNGFRGRPSIGAASEE
jgi:hypothetical protein